MTLVNDINLAALGEEWQGVARGVDDFAFLSVGTGLGMGLVLGGELHSGRHGAAGELDHALSAFGDDFDPSASAVSAYAAELAAAPGAVSALTPPYEPREVFTAARRGDPLARAVVAEVARRIALHIAPVAAVADVGLVVLGGGIGANGDLLLEPIRDMLASWLPYPPRLEVSSLGEAAVLYGALAIGLREPAPRRGVREPGARRTGGDACPGDRPVYPARRARTRSCTRLPSARPAASAIASRMTWPISRWRVAPTFAIALSTITSRSSSPSCAGR